MPRIDDLAPDENYKPQKKSKGVKKAIAAEAKVRNVTVSPEYKPAVRPLQPDSTLPAFQIKPSVREESKIPISFTQKDVPLAISLNTRANALPADFVEAHPTEAASLLTSAIPTNQLSMIAGQYHEGLGWANNAQVVDQVPGFLAPYYEMAFKAPTAEGRARALVFLDEVRDQPPEEQFYYLQSHIDNFDLLVRERSTSKTIMSSLQLAGIVYFPLTLATGTAGVIGKTALGIATAPVTGKIVQEGGGLLAEHGGGVPGLEAAGRGIEVAGKGISKTPAVAGGIIRGATGLPVAIAASAVDLAAGDPEAALRAYNNYFWDPAVHGGHAGITRAFFTVTGLDEEEHSGLASILDLANDTIGPLLIAKVALNIHTNRTMTPLGGGKMTGAEFVDNWKGNRFVNELWNAREEALAAGENPAAWIESNSKNMTIRQTRVLAEASTKEDFRRAVVSVIDDVPSGEDFANVRQEISANNKRIADVDADSAAAPPAVLTSMGDIGKIGLDDGTWVYRIEKPEFAEPTAVNGFDPTVSPTGKVYFSNDPFATFKLSDRVTRQGIGGEFNIYRVKKELTTMEQPKEWVSSEAIGSEGIEVWTDEGWRPVNGPRVLDADAIYDIQARNIALEQQLVDMLGRAEEPVFKIPSVSTVKSIVEHAPRGPITRYLSALYGGIEKVVDVEKLFNDMSYNEQRVVNPLSVTRRPDWVSYNTRVLKSNMSLAGVADDTQRALLGRMLELETATRSEVFRWAKDVYQAMEDGVTKGGKRPIRNFTPESLENLRFSERGAKEATLSPYTVEAVTPDGVTVRETRNVLENEHGFPMPTKENELLGDFIDMPNIELMRQTSSTIHYWDQVARNNPTFGRVYSKISNTAQLARFVALSIPRAILRPLLFYRPHTPFVIQADMHLREVALGLNPFKRRDTSFLPGGIPVKGVDGILSYFDSDSSALGGLIERQVAEGIPERFPVTTRGMNPHTDPAAFDVAQGVRDQLSHLHGSELARRVALLGPDGALRYIEAHPDSMVAQFVNREIAPGLAEQGVTIQEFLARTEQQIVDVTGGRLDYRRSVVTGKLPQEVPSALRSEQYEIELRQNELRQIADQEAQARLEGNMEYGRELHRRYEEVEGKITAAETRLTTKGYKALDITKEKWEVSDKIWDDWRTEGYAPPHTVYVSKRTTFNPEDVASGGRIQTRLATKVSAMSDALYRGLGKTVLRPGLELKGARGGMYYNLLKRNFDNLVKAGYEPELAARISHYRAAFTTRDIMYDLSARTSFDRATKDFFWFAPVLREQLSTWFYKIPNQMYWPVGITLELGTAHNLLKDLVDLGVGSWDEYGDFLLFGKLRAGSLNPVTPGGNSFVPTLSPTMETILDWTTKKAPKGVKDKLQWLSRNLTFDEGESGTDWSPATVDTILNAAFALSGTYVRVPYKDQFNPTMWRNQFRVTQTQSYQWAMSDLAKDGILPPKPGASQEEIDHYEDQVIQEAKNNEKGLALTRILGTFVSPLSIVVDNKTAETYYAWRDKQGIKYPYTQEDFDKINEYILKHPAAWPFAVGRYYQSDDPILPNDAPFMDKLAAGDISPLGGEDFIIRSMAQAGLKAEEAQLRSELRSAGVLSASDRLANYSTYSSIYADHLERVDNWLKANPEIEAYLQSKSDLSPNDQRLMELSRGLKIAREHGYFENLGTKEVKVVQAALAQAMQDIVFGPPNSKEAADIEWYFDSVYQPYRDKIDPLYDKVQAAFEAGNDAAAFVLLNQIRAINNQYGDIKHDGASYPTPEEFQFTSKTPQEQRQQTLEWAFRRPTSLTDFQQGKTGLPQFKGRDMLTAVISGIDSRFFSALANPHLTDDQRAQLTAQHDADIQRAAVPYGPQGLTFARLSQGTPVQRLMYTGYGKDNVLFGALAGQAEDIKRFADAHDVSWRYASSASGLFDMKVEFERKVQALRAIDPSLDKLFRRLEAPAAEHGDEYKLDVPLYEYLFFGQSTNKYNYQDPLVQAVERAL